MKRKEFTATLALVCVLITFTAVLAVTQKLSTPVLIVLKADRAYDLLDRASREPNAIVALPREITIEFKGDFIKPTERAFTLNPEIFVRLQSHDITDSDYQAILSSVRASLKSNDAPRGYIRCGECGSYAKIGNACEAHIAPGPLPCDSER